MYKNYKKKLQVYLRVLERHKLLKRKQKMLCVYQYLLNALCDLQKFARTHIS